MTDSAKRFLDAISKDETLQEKAKKLETPEKVLAFARELGFDLTEADLEMGKPKNGEIDDDELEAVAGGQYCACAAVGGGKQSKDTSEGRCGCAGYGQGNWKDSSMQEQYGPRCTCIVGGEGFTYHGETKPF